MTGRRQGMLLVVVLAMLAGATGMAASGIGSSRRNRNRHREPSRYYVLLLKDIDGAPVTEVVGDTKYSERRKQIEEEYKEAVLDWKRAAIAAKRAKEPFSEKPPQGPKLLKKLKSFKEEEDAEEYADKVQEALDKKMEAIRAKRGEKDDDFLDDPDDKGNAKKEGGKGKNDRQ